MNDVTPPQIGPVIQKARKARHLTLEQLSRLSGVSRSMLSQIERSETNPTFAVVWSLTGSRHAGHGFVPQPCRSLDHHQRIR